MEFEQMQIEVDDPKETKKPEKRARKQDVAQLNVRLDAETVEYAKAEAERLQISQAELVSMVIREHQADQVASVHPNFASDKDAFDSHLRQVTDLYTSVMAKYNTLREDVEAGVKEELGKRKAEIDKLKAVIRELARRAEKAEAEAKETAALRETIEAKDAAIADKDAIIAANASLSARLDEALARAGAADRAERELKESLQLAEKMLEVARSRIEFLTEQGEKDRTEAERHLEAARSEAESRIASLKAESEAALRVAEIRASERLEKAEATADRRAKEAKAESEARISKLESDLAGKDAKIAELYEKIAELSRTQAKPAEED